MMNKYAHHLSVAFVVRLEKFPIISHKNPFPKFVFQSEQGKGCFTGYLYEDRMDDTSILEFHYLIFSHLLYTSNYLDDYILFYVYRTDKASMLNLI